MSTNPGREGGEMQGKIKTKSINRVRVNVSEGDRRD